MRHQIVFQILSLLVAIFCLPTEAFVASPIPPSLFVSEQKPLALSTDLNEKTLDDQEEYTDIQVDEDCDDEDDEEEDDDECDDMTEDDEDEDDDEEESDIIDEESEESNNIAAVESSSSKAECVVNAFECNRARWFTLGRQSSYMFTVDCSEEIIDYQYTYEYDDAEIKDISLKFSLFSGIGSVSFMPQDGVEQINIKNLKLSLYLESGEEIAPLNCNELVFNGRN